MQRNKMSYFNGHMSMRNRFIDIKDNSCEFQESLEKVFLFFHVCRLKLNRCQGFLFPLQGY